MSDGLTDQEMATLDPPLRRYATVEPHEQEAWKVSTVLGDVYVSISRQPSGDVFHYDEVPDVDSNAVPRLRAEIDADPARRGHVDELKQRLEADMAAGQQKPADEYAVDPEAAGTISPDTGLRLVLLDVDGVLSPRRRPQGTLDRTWPDGEQITADGYRLVLSRQLGDAIAALPAHRRVWCTTWRGKANDFVCRHFGWQPLDVAEPPRGSEETSRSHAWKVDAVAAYLESLKEPPSGIVWVDDEHRHELGELVQARRADGWLADVELCLIAPDAHVGLAPWDLRTITDFLRDHQEKER